MFLSKPHAANVVKTMSFLACSCYALITIISRVLQKFNSYISYHFSCCFGVFAGTYFDFRRKKSWTELRNAQYGVPLPRPTSGEYCSSHPTTYALKAGYVDFS